MAGSMRLVGDNKDLWELRVFVGRDSQGRIRHVHRRFRGSKRAAERELARMVTDQEREPAPVPEEPHVWGPTTTINDAIEAWKSNGWDDLSPKTVIGYESVWDRYLKTTLGPRRIVSLSSYEIERYLRDLKKAGAGRDTVRTVRVMVHRACKLARKWSGGVLPNPAADAELPSYTFHERGEGVRAPRLEEVQALLDAAKAEDERVAAFVRVVAATGMRRGEACGIRWSNIDWERGSIRIYESVVTADGGGVVKPPKTRASIRAVTVDRDTLEALSELRTHQKELAAACGTRFADDGFAFSYEPGGRLPPHPDTMSHIFRKIRQNAGVATDVHLHSLRHFQATVLDSVISERQKQARLGWTTSHMARHYTDPVSQEDQRAAEYVGDLLTGRDGDTPAGRNRTNTKVKHVPTSDNGASMARRVASKLDPEDRKWLSERLRDYAELMSFLRDH